MPFPNLDGRPRKYASPEVLADAVREYFELCEQDKIIVDSAKGPVSRQRPFTISGLCCHLGISRRAWGDYGARPEFTDLCEQAKLICENFLEEAALTGRVHPIFAIFSAKNNFSWTEKIDLGLGQSTEPLQQSEIKELLAKRRLSLVTGKDEE